MVDTTQYGMGRIHQPDQRDMLFLAAERMEPQPRTAAVVINYLGEILNQLSTPRCVGYSGRLLLTSAPAVYPSPAPTADTLYFGAQDFDSFPGNNYDGSTIRGGAKYLQAQGLIRGDYLWAFDVKTVLDWILSNRGCVWFGTNWYKSMFEPSSTGLVSKIKGDLVGGHAYLAFGADKRYIYFANSWGKSWGDGGTFRMSHANVNRLLKEDGEACMATEIILP